MLAILANRTYRHLFAAQIIALAGTGLMTIALALLAYEIAGANAGVVLGTALAIKMIAYVLSWGKSLMRAEIRRSHMCCTWAASKSSRPFGSHLIVR